ncbi:MAG: hypothetical protein HYT11_04325 [Candidatus Levybacteria bacterium]|nr:hypothetical protein [Candidatus Levybacteria bacterium]
MEPSESMHLSPLAQLLTESLHQDKVENHERKISVNPVVSKFATWYEKVRNAMEYREDEVVLRAAIERILKRRLLLGGNAETTAEPLVRELIWAHYLPDSSVPVSIVNQVEQLIERYLLLRLLILKKHRMSEMEINEWIYQLMSANIEDIVNPHHEKEMVSNFMFQILKDQVMIQDDNQETKDAQVFIAVRKAFARDDIAFLRYNLFLQYFGELTEDNLEHIATGFPKGHQEIERQLHYPRKDRVYAYVRKRTAAFLILEDIFTQYKDDMESILQDKEVLARRVFSACDKRYKSIGSKVRRAVVRSVFFILLTKLFFAIFIEGTYERLFYGRILWMSIALNTGIPPLLMLVVSAFIRTPDQHNSKRILSYIAMLLFEDSPQLGSQLIIRKRPEKVEPVLASIFMGLWFLAFIISFGGMVSLLTRLHFTFISQAVFIFFLTLVSFLAYRISLTAHIYTVGDKQGFVTPIVDFLFMPVVRVGRKLAQSLAQVNFLLFIVDFFIETPFKVFFAFLERWFYFLHSKREEIE